MRGLFIALLKLMLAKIKEGNLALATEQIEFLIKLWEKEDQHG